MGRYLARRLVLLLPVALGITIVAFFLLRLIPGDPAVIMLDNRATAALTASKVVAAINAGADVVKVGFANLDPYKQDLGDANVSVESGAVAEPEVAMAEEPVVGGAVYAAVESITVEAPGVVRVVVTPGAGEHQRREKERTTRDAYREAPVSRTEIECFIGDRPLP